MVTGGGGGGGEGAPEFATFYLPFSIVKSILPSKLFCKVGHIFFLFFPLLLLIIIF